MAKQTKRTERTTGRKPAPKETDSKKAAHKKTPRACESSGAEVGKIVSMPCSRVLPTEEQIRTRAFEIYERRGVHYGDASHDWVQAERELQREMSR